MRGQQRLLPASYSELHRFIMELFVIVILLTVTDAQESQLSGPENTLSVVGSNANLKCSSPSRNCDGTEWLKLSGNPATVFNDRGIISSAYRDRYSVDNSSGCDLVIKNVELTDAGRFICRAFISSNTVEKTAHLVIQETQPKCTLTTSWNDTVEGDQVHLNCVVTYNETNRVSIVWRGVENASAVVETGKTKRGTYSIVASTPVVPSFTCITTFAVETKHEDGVLVNGSAANIPNTTCETSAIKVLSAQLLELEGPQNTLSVVGSNVTLKCSSASRNCSGIEWLKDSAEIRKNVYNNKEGTLSTYRDRYSVDNSSGCDLVIENVELTDAGRFICSAIILTRRIERVAYLTILETPPSCTLNASLNKTAEGDRIRFTCEVKYCGTNKASILWKDVTNTTEIQPKYTTNASQASTVEEEGTQLNCTVTYSLIDNVTSMVISNGKAISWSYYVTASAPEVQPFTCITSFALADAITNGTQIRGLARNIPNTTCETSVIKVLYSVRNVTLSPSLSNYATGRVITCTAKGHPPPIFKWQRMEDNSSWTDIQNLNGPEFNITNVSSKRYRCFALNSVRGKSHNATSHEFLVNSTDGGDDIFPNTTVTSFPVTMTAFLLILMASVAGGLFLLIIFLIVCFSVRSCLGCMYCHSGKKTKNKISEVQPLTESPDICIYSVVNKVQNAPPKAKPSSASNMESTQSASPQALSKTSNPKTGHTSTYQHEEVTYAELAMEFGPRQVVPKNNQPPQETLYAAVGAA